MIRVSSHRHLPNLFPQVAMVFFLILIVALFAVVLLFPPAAN